MIIKKGIIFLLALSLLFFDSCKSSGVDFQEDAFIAFSLKTAEKHLLNTSTQNDSSIYRLGGITRLLGLVIDRSANDIILVGKKNQQLPVARLDDLVVALRAKLIHNDFPMVSIDPVDNTLITKMQKVRFGGHIENTSFGLDFLNSDIFLKKYSLELEKYIQDVPSYKQLSLAETLDLLRKQGVTISETRWLSSKELEGFDGKIIEAGQSSQSRFWFNYKNSARVEKMNDVACIRSLDIVIQNEKTLNNPSDYIIDQPKQDAAELQFAKLFSDNYYKIGSFHPSLLRLKLLFDMTAIAEVLKVTSNIPDIGFLLRDYPVKKVPTNEEFELITLCAAIERADGKTSLVQLSGGIEISTDIEWLNDGNLNKLKKIVLDARPNINTLFWNVGLEGWKMPNNKGLVMHSEKKQTQSGFSVISNNVVLGKYTSDSDAKIFEGFKNAPIMLEPITTKGVNMKITIDTSGFTVVDSLQNLRKKILQ